MQRGQCGSDQDDVARLEPSKRERKPDHGHERRHDQERDDGEVGTPRELGEAFGARAVCQERRDEPGEREHAPALET